jgi:hypothetical protein
LISAAELAPTCGDGRSIIRGWGLKPLPQHGEALAAEQRRAENLARLITENVDRTFGAIEPALNQLAGQGTTVKI